MKTAPEFDLLVCLARPAPGLVAEARARDLLRAGLDWELFRALAWRHNLLPLAARNLVELFAADVPEPHLSRLREEFRHNAARNLLLASELCRVVEALDSAGVESVAYKGPALALQAYGDLKLRSFVDLDLLVRPGEAARASAVLGELGYRSHLRLTPAQERMLPRTECDRVFLREGRNLMLELHWAVAPPFFSVEVGVDEVLARRPARVELCGRGLLAPSPELTLLLLAVNGAKDLWTALEPLAAATGLLARHAGLDLAETAATARRAGAHRMLLVCLALAHDLFGARVPEEMLSEARADASVAGLVRESRARLSAVGAPPPGLAEKTRFRVRARERGRDRLRYCALKLFAPTYKDCAVELPTPLSFLYYGVRPFRLLRDRLRGARREAVL